MYKGILKIWRNIWFTKNESPSDIFFGGGYIESYRFNKDRLIILLLSAVIGL